MFENFQIEEGSSATAYSPYKKETYAVPQAILNLDGYGWSVRNAYNYVDFENKKYHKQVGRYVMTGDEQFYSDKMYIGVNSTNFYLIMDIGEKQSTDAEIISNKLSYLEYNWSEDTNYNTICFNSGNQIHIRLLNSELGTTNQTSIDEVITAMKNYCKNLYESDNPIIIYYELAEPIVTDISDIIGDTFQEPFEVESGGSLTFKNTNGDGYKVAVPSNIQYVVSLSEVNS